MNKNSKNSRILDDMANGRALVQDRNKPIDQHLCFAGTGRSGHPRTCGGVRCALLSEGHVNQHCKLMIHNNMNT
jgi:hypothetical protein